MFDVVVMAGVAASQFAIAAFLFADWRRRMNALFFAAALTCLTVVWSLVGYGVWLSWVSGARRTPGPPWLHSLGSSFEFLWGFLSTIAVIVYAIYRLASRRIDEKHSPQRRALLRRGAAVAFAAPAAAVAFGGIIGRTNYQVREVDFPVRGLHSDLQGLRIAHVSDFHVSPFLSVREAARVVDMTNELRPHLAFMTGDLITEHGDPLDDAIREICRLRAEAGVLGCLGNHERYVNAEAYVADQAAKKGVRFLRHQAVQLQFGAATLNVAGVDFQTVRRRPNYLQSVDELMRPGMTNLLLSHNPDVFPKAAEQGWDGMLAGHTHGGQVTVEIFEQSMNLARFITPYVAGLYRIGEHSCYVTRGIGTIGMPVRIGESPEITLLRLVRA